MSLQEGIPHVYTWPGNEHVHYVVGMATILEVKSSCLKSNLTFYVMGLARVLYYFSSAVIILLFTFAGAVKLVPGVCPHLHDEIVSLPIVLV